MCLKKKRNKGFSLVELIVVILIMAVLAVALAPQVMKWVGNARRARDWHNYEQMVSVVQEAITYSGVYEEVNSDSEITLTIHSGENTLVAADGRSISNLINTMNTLHPGWKTIDPTDNSAAYYIKIKNGRVIRDTEPDVSGIN